QNGSRACPHEVHQGFHSHLPARIAVGDLRQGIPGRLFRGGAKPGLPVGGCLVIPQREQGEPPKPTDRQGRSERGTYHLVLLFGIAVTPRATTSSSNDEPLRVSSSCRIDDCVAGRFFCAESCFCSPS